jgi:hypothetical protein
VAYVAFHSKYAPCGFLIVPDGLDLFDDRAVLIQTDWDHPGVASRMGWTPCPCGRTDGTVDCPKCERTASEMIAEAYDFIEAHEGETFDALDDYLEA